MVLPLSARGLLLWCLAAALAIEAFFHYVPQLGFAAIFGFLLAAGDWPANWLLLALAVLAFLLRNRAHSALVAVRAVGSRPWLVAAVLFPALCAGCLVIYHDHALSMDEYTVLFQAKVFAAGRLTGAFPPELLDVLIPIRFQNSFFAISRASGEVSSAYQPGFALLLAPFAWLNVAWAANPLIGALAVPTVHRLTREVTGSPDAAAWSVVLMLASPVFVVDSISYYSMQASFLCNALFALLLLRPTVASAAAAGVVGSIALTLHQPVAHLLFLLPCAVWLLTRPRPWRVLAALAIGYVPFVCLLGVAWHAHMTDFARSGLPVAAIAAPEPSLIEIVLRRLASVMVLPNALIVEARLAGLTKVWTWAAAGLVVLAVAGFAAARASAAIRLLAAALAVTFLGYFVVPYDQGHGWGYRYLHSAWFVLPVLAAAGLEAARGDAGRELRGMAAWLVVFSLLFANGLRLFQVDAFITEQLAQVPPLTRPAPHDGREIVFIRRGAGYYVEDLVQNDPLLRSTRMTMIYQDYGDGEGMGEFMAQHFPGYVRQAQEDWGELWIERQPAQRR